MPRNTITPAVSRPSRVPVSIVTRGGAATRAAASAARIAAPIKNGRLGTPNDAVARCELQRTTTRELQTDDYRPVNCKVTTTGRGLMACRPSASGGLVRGRALARGGCDPHPRGNLEAHTTSLALRMS